MFGSQTLSPTSSSVCLHIYFSRHIYNWNIVDSDVKQPNNQACAEDQNSFRIACKVHC